MKKIIIENCDECPYCKITPKGEDDYLAECEKFDIFLCHSIDPDCFDIVEGIHPDCELIDD